MAGDDRAKWDRQHAASYGSDQASGFLKEVLLSGSWPIPRGRALDIAAGKGRNAIFLAERGFDVVAIDVSPVALDEARGRAAGKSLSISWQQADLEQIELPKTTYDLIVNFNYLQRSLIPQIKAALRPGGHAIFETYLIGQEVIGHPKNPAYLLRHNELLELFRDFRVLCYREGKFSEGEETAFRAGILAETTK
jgi:SAM-dependent methyltransferase